MLAHSPANIVATHNLSLLLSKVGRPAEAESLIAPLVRASPDPGNMMLQLLLAQVTQRHDDDVRRTLAAMAPREQDLPLYVWGRGIALHAMRDYDGADRAYRDLQLRTRDPIFQSLATFGLARVSLTRGKLAEAERQMRVSVEVSERRGLAGRALGAAADLALATVVYRGDSAGALKVMHAALEQHPLDSVPALDRPGANIALVYAVAGQHARGHQLLAAYENQVPEGIRRGRWEWYEARGWLALAEGRPRDAVTAFTQGRNADTCPDCGAWDEGVAYERAGLPDSALAAYERAASRGTTWKSLGDAWGLAPSLKRLGEMYEARGDRQRALESYGRFAELWKDADPVLQPAVREVRGRMAGLVGEGK